MRLQRFAMSPQRKQGHHLACAAGFVVRGGMTLLEVIISLAIFLFSMVALLHLMSLSGERARDGLFQTEATLRCQSKLAEVMHGAIPLASSSWSDFPEAPEWNWEVEVQGSEYTKLSTVQVGVRRKKADGSYFEVRLSQMVFDPAQRGSTLINPANTSGTTTTPGNNSTPGSNNTPGTSGSGGN